MTESDISLEKLSPEDRKKLAAEMTENLDRALRQTDPLPPLSLWQIDDQIMQLAEAREQAQAEGALPEELKALDDELDRYAMAQVKKVDGICHMLHLFAEREDEAQAESRRLAEHSARWKARAERLKAATLRAMNAHGVRVLETPTNKLRVQANGGLQPLELGENIPPDFIVQILKMSAHAVQVLRLAVTNPQAVGDDARAMLVRILDQRTPFEINNQGIRDALKLGPVPCAKLLPRGEHLRVE